MTLFRDTEAGSFKIWFGWGFHKSKARFLKIRVTTQPNFRQLKTIQPKLG